MTKRITRVLLTIIAVFWVLIFISLPVGGVR